VGIVTAAVEQQIRAKIAAAGPGGKLPSERALAAETGACRATVRMVLRCLVAAGVIRSRPGSGYYVSTD
jgi:DNA-binding GntR family transcriptional regulator